MKKKMEKMEKMKMVNFGLSPTVRGKERNE